MSMKEKCSALKLEELEANTLYAITINPVEQYPEHKDRYKDTIHFHCFSFLNKLRKYSELELYPELSPLGRIHYHGTVKIIDPVEFLLKLFQYAGVQKTTFTVVIKHIKDEKWLGEYCIKQKAFMEPYSRKKNIAYPINNKYIEILQHQKAQAQIDYDLTKYRV